MNHHRTIALCVTVTMTALLSACAGNVAENSVAEDSVDDGEQFESSSIALETLASELPPNTSDVREVRAINVYGCRFTIGIARQAPPFPPAYLTWIRKTTVPGRYCRRTGYQVVNSSSFGSTVDIAKHPLLPLVVFSATTKSLSGSSPIQLVVGQVDYRDLSIVRTDKIIALRERSPSGGSDFGPFYGNVYSGYLDVDLFGNLTVTGTFTGYFPGMTGSGTNYQAFYQSYVFTPPRSYFPDSVIAY